MITKDLLDPFVVIGSITLVIRSCSGQGGGGVEANSLVTSLFSNYSTSVRPNTDYMTPMQVDIDLFLVGINDLDEVEGKLTTTGYLWCSWTDEFLKWDDSNGIMQIHISQSKIWKPDLTLKNGFTKLNTLGTDFILAQIDSSGFVTWLPFEVFETKCSIDITYFPFDEQTCELIFVVWSYSIMDVNVTLGSKGIILDEIDENGQWKILSTSSKEDKESFESKVTFSMTMERNSGYYIFNIIIPVVFLGLLNVFTFVIPCGSGEKMSYAMTVFLSFAVFLTIVSSELPKSSGSYLGYYLMLLLGLGVITVCTTAFELRIQHRDGPVSSWVAKMIRCGCCCCSGSENKVEDTEGTQKKIQRKTEWVDVTSAIDFFMFWTLLFIFMISTAICMIVLKLKA